MTPFDVVKTRLQTQAPPPQLGFRTSLPPPSRSATSPWPPPIPSTSIASSNPNQTPTSAQPAPAAGPKTYFLHNATDNKPTPRSSGAPRAPLPTSAPHVSLPVSGSSAAALHLSELATAEPFKPRHFTGFFDAVSAIVRHEGASALWRGTAPALMMSIPGQVVYMVGYDWGRRTGFENAPQWAYSPQRVGEERTLRPGYLTAVPLVAGSLSRTVVACLVSPMELVRTRLQASTASTTLGDVIRGLRADGGWRNGWRGLPPTLWRDVPFSGIYWAAYEGIKRSLTGGKGMGDRWEGQGAGQEFTIAFVSGAGSGMVRRPQSELGCVTVSLTAVFIPIQLAASLTNPFDVVKTRRQAQSSAAAAGKPVPTKTFEILFDIARKEGLRGLMSGLTPRLAKIGPACGIMIGTYEGLSRYMD